MPADRSDPADYPNEPNEYPPPEGSRPPDAPPLPLDPADVDAVHRANRAKVEQVNAAHREGAPDGPHSASANADRDPWAEAVPSLRAAWEEHQTAIQNGSVLLLKTTRMAPGPPAKPAGLPRAERRGHQGLRRHPRRRRPGRLPSHATNRSRRPQPTPGRSAAYAQGNDRLKEKIAERLRYNPNLSPRQAAAGVPDAVRFTFAYSKPDYTDGVRADVERLQGAGYDLLKLKNLRAKDQYRGINSQRVRPETGLRIEVQFHTQQSHEAKELTHKAYERLRDPLTSKAEESELEAYQRRVNALVQRPPDVFRIEDYPPEKRDG